MTVLERWAAAHMDRSVTCYATLHDYASARREVAEALATADGPDRAYWWQMMVAIETVIGEATHED